MSPIGGLYAVSLQAFHCNQDNLAGLVISSLSAAGNTSLLGHNNEQWTCYTNKQAEQITTQAQIQNIIEVIFFLYIIAEYFANNHTFLIRLSASCDILCLH